MSLQLKAEGSWWCLKGEQAIAHQVTHGELLLLEDMCNMHEKGEVVQLLPGKTEITSFTDFRNQSSLRVSVGRNPL